MGFVTGAHTVKYLDSEAIAAVEGEATLALSTGVTFNSVGFEAFNAIGVANARFIGAVFVANNNYTDSVEYIATTGFRASSGTTILSFIIPLPTNKGTMDLFLGDVKLYVATADASNKIDSVEVYKYTQSTGTYTLVHTNGTDITTSGAKTLSFTPSNVSTGETIIIQVKIVQATDRILDFNGLQIEYYYA